MTRSLKRGSLPNVSRFQEEHCFLEGFQAWPLSLWREQRVDEDEYLNTGGIVGTGGMRSTQRKTCPSIN